MTFRAIIATTLAFSFVIYPQLRMSSARTAYAAVDLKSASQFKTDAARYENAIRAIGGIATMKLETLDDLKQAIAILNRERPNLRFHFSKLVVMGLNDSTFTRAATKRVPDKQAAEAFAKELDADPKAILKLDGATALQARMQQSSAADAATLRWVAQRLKEAADKIKKTSQARLSPRFGSTDEFTLIKVGYNATRRTDGVRDPFTMFPQGGPGEAVLLLVAVVLIVVVGVPLIAIIGTAIKNLVTNLFTKDGQDALSECQKKADDGLEHCLEDAKTRPFPGNLLHETECNTIWLIEWSACLVT